MNNTIVSLFPNLLGFFIVCDFDKVQMRTAPIDLTTKAANSVVNCQSIPVNQANSEVAEVTLHYDLCHGNSYFSRKQYTAQKTIIL